MYKPYIFKLNQNKDTKLDFKVVLSTIPNQSLFSLGYHYYLDRTKNDLINYTKVIKSENNFYYVMNPFENSISNYDDNLNKLAHIYLNIDKNTSISNSLYKMWEILFMFDIGSQKECKYLSYDKDNSSFTKAVSYYRSKFGLESKNDKTFNYTTINYDKVKKDIGKFNANLITCNMVSSQPNIYQEQESYKLILSEIIFALKFQEYQGNFVLRIFDTFTHITLKMIYLLTILYEDVYLHKPYYSRPTSSEKYIICKKFKFHQDDKNLNIYINGCQNMLDNITFHVFDILPNLELSQDYLNNFKLSNIKLVNPQQIMINLIITYIKENNYYGDKFQMHRDAQISATKWWSRMFFPPSKNLYESNKEEVSKLIETVINKNNIDQTEFNQHII